MKMDWWQASIVASILFIPLINPIFGLLEVLVPVDHTSYDFGGRNFPAAICLAFLFSSGITVVLSRTKQLHAVILAWSCIALLFLLTYTNLNIYRILSWVGFTD
jgi:hypothetical protein